jgi:hypothetical protein
MQESATKIKAQYNDTWQAFVVAEASSFLYTGRVQRSHLNPDQVNQWQEDVLTTILQLESVYDNIADHEVGLYKNYINSLAFREIETR